MTRRTFGKLLGSAARSAAIYDFHHAELRKASARGLKPKDAHGEASKTAAKRFGRSRRTIERVVREWPGKERELKQQADSDYVQFDQRARLIESISQWFSPTEFAEIRTLALSDQAVRAIPRAAARVKELEVDATRLKQMMEKLLRRNLDLEAKLRRHEKDRAVKAAGLEVYSRRRSNSTT